MPCGVQAEEREEEIKNDNTKHLLHRPILGRARQKPSASHATPLQLVVAVAVAAKRQCALARRLSRVVAPLGGDGWVARKGIEHKGSRCGWVQALHACATTTNITTTNNNCDYGYAKIVVGDMAWLVAWRGVAGCVAGGVAWRGVAWRGVQPSSPHKQTKRLLAVQQP